MRIFKVTSSRGLLLVGSSIALLSVIALASAAGSDLPAPSSSSSSSKTSAGNGSGSTAAQTRQSSATMLGTLGSLVPGLITNVAPLVLLVGLGALMMPALGAGAMGLLRESRRSANDQLIPTMQLPAAFAQYARPLQTSPQDIYYFTKRSFPGLMSNLNSGALLHGAHELLERVLRAIDNADRRYN